MPAPAGAEPAAGHDDPDQAAPADRPSRRSPSRADDQNPFIIGAPPEGADC